MQMMKEEVVVVAADDEDLLFLSLHFYFVPLEVEAVEAVEVAYGPLWDNRIGTSILLPSILIYCSSSKS